VLHTYRDPKVLARRGRQPLDVVSGAAVCLLVAFLISALRVDALWRQWSGVLVPAALMIALAWLSSRRHDRVVCGEIRLDDSNGTCELDTARGPIALHVREITSIEYERDGDSSSEYFIRFGGRRIPVERGMADFPDFLERLRELNPDVDLSSIPA
jgi:hypothetical protein